MKKHKKGKENISKKLSLFRYDGLLDEIKKKIQQAQTRSHLAVNQEVIMLYWEIGKSIAKRQEQQGYGAKVIEKLSDDLQIETSSIISFSVRNLIHMLKFYRTYEECALVKQLVSQLPWGHNIVILQKVKTI